MRVANEGGAGGGEPRQSAHHGVGGHQRSARSRITSYNVCYTKLLRPVYEELPGWQESTVGVRDYAALPANARAYLKRIEEVVGVPVDIISTGPDRTETIIQRNPFA